MVSIKISRHYYSSSRSPLLIDVSLDPTSTTQFATLLCRYASNRFFSAVWRSVFLASALASVWILVSVCSSPAPPRQFKSAMFSSRGFGKRNLIMMVSDGFGPTSETFGRTMYQHIILNNNTARSPLNVSNWGPVTPLDSLFVGTSRTRSTSSFVTDSAAGATAFSCAQKTYNGAISVTDDNLPCATVFEAAKLSGYKTGLVATSRITHATPASFNSHTPFRDYENDIAEHQIGDIPVVGRTADLMLGGGRRHFVPAGHPESVRDDQRDLLVEAQQRGFTVLTSRKDFDALNSSHSLPVLGVFTPDHMSYNIDRDPLKEPSLKEMAQRALALLYDATLSDPDSPGFFIMIEGSRIDMAAHSNDPGAHSNDILHYYEVIQAVREFVDQCPDKTVMVSTSDHETGGLSLARQLTDEYPEYLWNPAAVAGQSKSTVILAEELVSAWKNVTSEKERRTTLVHLVAVNLNITDMTDAEVNSFFNSTLSVYPLDLMLANLVSVRAQLGWATHGHSGADVNLYAHGPGIHKLRGSLENTEVGLFLQEYLGVKDKMAALNIDLQRELKFKHPIRPPPKHGPS